QALVRARARNVQVALSHACERRRVQRTMKNPYVAELASERQARLALGAANAIVAHPHIKPRQIDQHESFRGSVSACACYRERFTPEGARRVIIAALMGLCALVGHGDEPYPGITESSREWDGFGIVVLSC